ncbi:MAG: DUF1080 domain-containing protein [Pedobacter sp.]|nr:MAG: DUF1080 domain-containing protein [Pedobacter sp.]
MKQNSILFMLRTVFVLGLPFIFLGSSFKSTPPHLKWEQLFNGKDLKDWQPKIRYHDLNDNYANTFRVKDGQIQVRYDGYTQFDETFGHLFYKKSYSYYLIAAEYRFVNDQVKGGPGWAYRNSGIMVHGQDPAAMKKDQDFPNSIEVQLLGGTGNGERPTANLCTPGTQFVLNGKVVKNHCIESSSKTFNGEQWVRVEVLVLGDSTIVHYINGDEVLRYDRPQKDPVGGADEGELIKGGTISLQSESHPVDFRKVEIINLDKYAKDPAKLAEVIKSLMAEKRIAKQ